MTPDWKKLMLLYGVLIIAACGPSAEEKSRRKAELQERRRIECLDKICPGDKEPLRNWETEELLKLNGHWFVGPKAYFSSGMNGAAFYWPSKTPMTGRPDRQPYPEQGKFFYDVTIEIFLRSNNIPAEPRGYVLIQLAEKNGWVASRETLRSGLDKIQMKHVVDPQGQYMDHVTYYVATELTGMDGLPPVATCNHDNVSNGGGTGFLWKPEIWAGTRMNQKHCADWPEIYQETIRVLSLVKEIK